MAVKKRICFNRVMCTVLLILVGILYGIVLSLNKRPLSDLFTIYEEFPSRRAEDDEDTVHIVLTLDERMLTGLQNLINSVLTSTAQAVHFHIMWCDGDPNLVSQYLACFDIQKLNSSRIEIAGNIQKYMTPTFWAYLNFTATLHKTIAHCSNIMRLQTHKVFPHLDRAVWLDVDMIVQGDIGDLWSYIFTTEWIMVAKRSSNNDDTWATFAEVFGEDFVSDHIYALYFDRYGRTFDQEGQAFNNAVALLNLRKWRENDDHLQREYAFWMRAATSIRRMPRDKWWYYISQSIMWLVYGGDITFIPLQGWHCDGLGWDRRDLVSLDVARTANLLHWNGAQKPWLDKSGPHYQLWEQYSPKQCEGAGLCTVLQDNRTTFKQYKCISK